MSDSHGTTSPFGAEVDTAETPGKMDAAKQEAADLKDTATDQAKDVLGTAKDEASTVVGEAKYQAKDLYAQARQELGDQAGVQQQRIATGLRAVGDDLGSMAANSDGSSVAGDLVQQVSSRLSSAATWLGDRDPSSVLTEVKRFARRRPGTFIIAAAVTGIVVGRLTRALAANASDQKSGSGAPMAALPPADPWSPSDAQVTAPPVADTPIYAEATSAQTDAWGASGDGRPDTL